MVAKSWERTLIPIIHKPLAFLFCAFKDSARSVGYNLGSLDWSSFQYYHCARGKFSSAKIVKTVWASPKAMREGWQKLVESAGMKDIMYILKSSPEHWRFPFNSGASRDLGEKREALILGTGRNIINGEKALCIGNRTAFLGHKTKKTWEKAEFASPYSGQKVNSLGCGRIESDG